MKLNYIEFLDKLISHLDQLGIDLTGAKLDHLAYYARSSDEYNDLKDEFKKIGLLLREPLVGGRRVGVFKLRNPLEYRREKIAAIELIEPKENQLVAKSGLEHAEFLLPVSLEEFVEKYPNVNWDKSRMDRDEFPVLKLKLTKDMQVKFPRKPILAD